MRASNKVNKPKVRGPIAVFAALGFSLLLLFAVQISSARAQNRARLTHPAQTAKPSPTPTPTSTGRPAMQMPAATPVQTTSQVGGSRSTLGDAPPPPKLKAPDYGEDIKNGDILKIDTNNIILNVRVIDRNNHPIDRLTQNEFRVFEDGVPQQVESLDRREVPVTYGLAVDTSGSLRTQLQSVIDAAKTIINSNKPGDESFLERFISSDKIETLQDFTSSKDQLIDALDNLYIEGGQTAVVDGVYLAAEHVAEYKKSGLDDRRRRALIVITDGEDRNSYYKEVQLFQRLREEDVQIYVIGFIAELDKDAGFIRKSPRDKAVNLINKLASDTGGRAFFPTSLADLPGIASEIVRDLRTQYVVAYNPTNKKKDGTYRAIRVTVADGPTGEKRIALTRPGYIATPEGAAPKTPAGRSAARPPATGANKNPR